MPLFINAVKIISLLFLRYFGNLFNNLGYLDTIWYAISISFDESIIKYSDDS
jgi:hypothetical protein